MVPNHHLDQGWGEYYSGTRLAQNDKHEYTKNIVLEYYSSTDFPVLVLVCSLLAPALTWTNGDLPAIWSCAILIGRKIEGKHDTSVNKMCLKIKHAVWFILN